MSQAGLIDVSLYLFADVRPAGPWPIAAPRFYHEAALAPRGFGDVDAGCLFRAAELRHEAADDLILIEQFAVVVVKAEMLHRIGLELFVAGFGVLWHHFTVSRSAR